MLVMLEPYGETALIPPVSGASHTPGFFLRYFVNGAE